LIHFVLLCSFTSGSIHLWLDSIREGFGVAFSECFEKKKIKSLNHLASLNPKKETPTQDARRNRQFGAPPEEASPLQTFEEVVYGFLRGAGASHATADVIFCRLRLLHSEAVAEHELRMATWFVDPPTPTETSTAADVCAWFKAIHEHLIPRIPFINGVQEQLTGAKLMEMVQHVGTNPDVFVILLDHFKVTDSSAVGLVAHRILSPLQNHNAEGAEWASIDPIDYAMKGRDPSQDCKTEIFVQMGFAIPETIFNSYMQTEIDTQDVTAGL
jgi:hypothetical protein